MQRRSFVSALAGAGVGAVTIGLVPGAGAQRPAQPIARPPGQGPNRPLVPGRFGSDDGAASGAVPGVFVVVGVNTQDDTLQLRDPTGRTGLVHVKEHTFDLGSLKPGDEVEVDFVVPEPGRTKLVAGSLWKVQR
jgi:hypothetical protein